MNDELRQPAPPPEDDPVLTAYALGALSPAQAAQVSARLERDEAARAFVESLMALSSELGQAQAAKEEPDQGLTPAQRRELRALIARRAPSRMKFPRAAVVCVVVSVLLALLMTLFLCSVAWKR